jgi:hypothetical protein
MLRLTPTSAAAAAAAAIAASTSTASTTTIAGGWDHVRNFRRLAVVLTTSGAADRGSSHSRGGKSWHPKAEARRRGSQTETR